jgi:hypothetical protein
MVCRVLCTADCGMLNCVAVSLVDFFVLRTNVSRNLVASTSVACRSPGLLFVQTQPALSNNLYHLQMDIFVGIFLPYVRNLLCTVTADFDWRGQNLPLVSAFETPFSTTAGLAPLVARRGNSCITTSKLDHITFQNTFSFRSCDFQFVSSSTLKSSTFCTFIMRLRSNFV